MQIKGADFLKARKLDRELENVIHNLFGKKYIVNINFEFLSFRCNLLN